MSTKEVVQRLMHYVKPYGALLVGALVCAVIYVVMSLLSPVLIGQAVDGIIGPGQVDFAGIGRIALYLVFVLAAGGLFQWLMTLCTNKVCYRTVKDLRTEVFSRIIHVPLKFIDQNAHGNIITILGTVGFMISINPWIALVVVALTPVSLVIATLIARGTHTTFLKQSRIQGELSGHVEEMLSGQKLVKLFGHEKASEEKLEEINQRLYVWGYKAQIYPSFTNPLTRFVNGLVYAAVGVAGALAAVRGVLTIGQLSCFLSYANQYTKPFNEVTGIMAQLQTAKAAARRLMALIDEPVEEEASPLQHLPQGNTPIAFEDVSFHYLPDRPLIEHFHLEVQPGQRIAIVGPTGCGKTTLINLLMPKTLAIASLALPGKKSLPQPRQPMRTASFAAYPRDMIRLFPRMAVIFPRDRSSCCALPG